MPRLALLLVLLALSLAAGCPAPGGPPPSDACSAPSGGSVDGVEIAAATAADLAGEATTFVPLAEGDGVTLIRGGQGATMIGLILRLSGAAVPACLGQRTIVTSGGGVTDAGGERVAAGTAPLNTYPQPDGSHVTHPLWLPGSYPDQFAVAVEAADKSLMLNLHLNLAK